MRVLLPIRRLLLEVAAAVALPSTLQATIHAEVFEDNNGALILATNQRITSRTKYFLLGPSHQRKRQGLEDRR